MCKLKLFALLKLFFGQLLRILFKQTKLSQRLPLGTKKTRLQSTVLINNLYEESCTI